MNRRAIPCFGLGVSLALHAVVLTLAARHLVTAPDTPVRAADEPPVIQMTLMPPTLPAPVDIRPVPEVRPAAVVPVARAVSTQPVPTAYFGERDRPFRRIVTEALWAGIRPVPAT